MGGLRRSTQPPQQVRTCRRECVAFGDPGIGPDGVELGESDLKPTQKPDCHSTIQAHRG